MDFVEATDRITGACVTLADIAEVAGVSDNSIRRARLDPSSQSYRSPPADWPALLVRLARDRARALEALAEELEAES